MELEVKSVKITAEESMPHLWRACGGERDGVMEGERKSKSSCAAATTGRLSPSAVKCHAVTSSPRRRGRLFFHSCGYRPH